MPTPTTSLASSQATMDMPAPTIVAPSSATVSASASPTTSSPNMEPEQRPEIILLAGIGGCGKSQVLAGLKAELGQDNFTFFDISEYEDALWRHGYAMDSLAANDRVERLGRHVRDTIEAMLAHTGKPCIVASGITRVNYNGELNSGGTPAFLTSEIIRIRDCALVLYMSEDLRLVAQYRGRDARPRLPMPIQDLWSWWKKEEVTAKTLAHEHGVPIKELRVCTMPDFATRVALAASSIRHFFKTTEESNLASALSLADKIGASQRSAGRVVVMDADNILTDLNTWKAVSGEIAMLRGEPGQQPGNRDQAYEVTFDPAKRGDFEVLRQLSYLVSNNAGELYALACCNVARRIATSLPPEFERLLWQLKLQERFLAVILTSGPQLVWDMVLELALPRKSYLMGPVAVHGVMAAEENKPLFTPNVKAAFVKKLREDYQLRVHTFGAEPHDVPMANAAGVDGFIVRKEWRREAGTTAVSDPQERPLSRVLMLRTEDRGLIDGLRLPMTMDLGVGDIYEAIGLLCPDDCGNREWVNQLVECQRAS